MSIPKKTLADVIAALGKAVAADDAAALTAVHHCLASYHTASRSTAEPSRVTARVSEAKGKTRTSTARAVPMFDAPDDLSARFAAFENRDALGAFIRSYFGRKVDVIAVARKLGVPVVKEDDYEVIVDKLIDGTIGYKLRSRAIRGEDDPGRS